MLKAPDGSDDRPVSLFGISCTRQLDASTLIERSPEVTRSTVQKAVVVIADTPVYFGGLKEKLGMVTRAWFAQRLMAPVFANSAGGVFGRKKLDEGV